jgi:glycosyltransferase involved in cell wall biosynthesis
MNAQYPKVSVFLPTYNQLNFVKEAIESVLVQNYPNIEIVIGDDGSADGTQQVLVDYKSKYPSLIKLILSEKNNGITFNCNNILRECTGDYIALLAGDDVWLPGKLHKQIEFMRNNKDVVLCYTKVEVFDNESGNILAIQPKGSHLNFNQDDIIGFTYILGHLGSSFMIKSTAIPADGFNSLIPNVSDWLFWIEVLRKGKAGYIDEILAKYRRHKNNASDRSHIVFAEHLLTLNIIECKYPDLQYFSNYYRSKFYLHRIRSFKFTTLLKLVLSEFISRISIRLSLLMNRYFHKSR